MSTYFMYLKSNFMIYIFINSIKLTFSFLLHIKEFWAVLFWFKHFLVDRVVWLEGQCVGPMNEV